VALAPWDGAAPWKLTAKLLYRLRDGELRIGYELLRLEEAQREAFAEIVKAVEASTGLVSLAGTPPAKP
jgi:hypothetical protein